MPYCPQCGYEYKPGIRICPDCNSLLEEKQPLICGECEERVSEEATFCPHCGVLLEGPPGSRESLFCATHPDRQARGSCVICRRMLCRDCARTRNGRMFCDNDEHVKAAFNWVVACTSSTEYEAEMIRANLEGAGIGVFVLPQRDRMYVATVGDLSVTEVMVPAESLEEARAYIRSIEAGEPPASLLP